MGNNQVVGEYVSEEELRQEFLDLFKTKLTRIDIEFFDNYLHLNYLFRSGLNEDMFVSITNYTGRRTNNSYYRRRIITRLILVKYLYNWYSNSIL